MTVSPAGPRTPKAGLSVDRSHIAADFQAVIAEIRSLDNFSRFLAPPTVDQLIGYGEAGPVVVVNVSRYQSDALAVTDDGIQRVPLPGLAHDALIEKINTFHRTLRIINYSDAGRSLRRGSQDTLNEILEWLWDVAAEPILNKLDYRHVPPGATAWPRLWWAPGGLLGLLPIHAAGYHRDSPGANGRRTVMDRVISSYTPTMRALNHARERGVGASENLSALIVAMPTTPEATSLRYVEAEAAALQARLPHTVLLMENSEITNQATPTKARVLEQLTGCDVAHFACHGDNDPADPSRSRLLLHDHRTDPLTVGSLVPIKLDHPQLAYLSACNTALNASMELIDEAIHMTAAFLLAAYPHVIGTLWEINDAVAVRVADAFYAALTTGDHGPDTSQSASALHHAIRAVRDHAPEMPSLWAAYLHVGA